MPKDQNSMRSSLSELVAEIESGKIMLPDFQREFVWRDEEMQCKIVASVLAKMPVGSILLLEGSSDEYSIKMIGQKSKGNSDSNTRKLSTVNFLLDGQQRITVLSNVFSSVIFDHVGNKFSELVSPALKRRFFLQIPKWSVCQKELDLFRVHDLDLPTDFGTSEPSFLSNDILAGIKAYSFVHDDHKSYNPEMQLGVSIDSFCLSSDPDHYLIPLYLAIPTGKATQKNQISLRYISIINSIADNIVKQIMNSLAGLSSNDAKWQAIVRDILLSDDENDDEMEGMPEKLEYTNTELQQLLSDRAKVWANTMRTYLQNCIQDMQLSQIFVGSSQRARAIDIYENLNRGGVSLNTFDLIMARVAKVDNHNFFKRVVDGMTNTHLANAPAYPNGVIPPLVHSMMDSITHHLTTYNATISMGCYNENKNEIASKYIDVFLDVLGLYNHNTELKADVFRVDQIKKDSILRIDPQFISDNCEKVITAIDRAFFFFQTRCGIRSLQEINYNLMIVLVATIFLKDEYYHDVKVHDRLEAWYWSVVFSGEYDHDQNVGMIDHLNKMISTIEGQKSIDWIKSMSKHVLDMPNFSDKELLLMKKKPDRLPKQVLRSFVCQFFLASTYSDMFDPNLRIGVFCKEAGQLEAHHIIPLKSVASINVSSQLLRKDPEHICNSPLNFVYITKSANLQIGAKSLDDYLKLVQSLALSDLCMLTTDPSDPESVLTQRYAGIRGKIHNRITTCLS